MGFVLDMTTGDIAKTDQKPVSCIDAAAPVYPMLEPQPALQTYTETATVKTTPVVAGINIAEFFARLEK